MTAADQFTALLTALDGIVPQSLNWTNITDTDDTRATVYTHTCHEFATICGRLNIPARKRGHRGLSGSMAARVEYWADGNNVIVMHNHWPHSVCDDVQPQLTEETP